MDYTITSSNLAEYVQSLQAVQPGANRLVTQGKLPKGAIGEVNFRPYVMPGIQALELSWQLSANRILIAETHAAPSELTINVSFQLQGSMLTRFSGIRHPMDMKTGVHNLVYLTENCGNNHAIEGNQHLSALSLTIDKQYFIQCIDGGSHWSDEVINKIEKNIPFAATEQSLAITPRMHHLIQCIQNDTTPGPMKKLLFQSRMLELIAMQVAQYSSYNKKENSCLGADDTQKLYALKVYLDTHFLADLSLAQLSRVSCLNEFKLKKGFKSEFGETVFGYVRKLRMQHAGNLLHDTAHTVDEIAALLGYEYAHHFAKAFKAHTGYLPGAYRSRRSF